MKKLLENSHYRAEHLRSQISRLFQIVEVHERQHEQIHSIIENLRNSFPNASQARQISSSEIAVFYPVENRRDHATILAAIQSQMKYFLMLDNDNNEQLFCTEHLSKIERIEKLIPNWNKGDNLQKAYHFDLEAYKKALHDINNYDGSINWNEVFAKKQDYEKFKYLHEHYNNPKYVRWTHIYLALRETFNIHISEKTYIAWIRKNYNPEFRANRLQSNAGKTNVQFNNLVEKLLEMDT